MNELRRVLTDAIVAESLRRDHGMSLVMLLFMVTESSPSMAISLRPPLPAVARTASRRTAATALTLVIAAAAASTSLVLPIGVGFVACAGVLGLAIVRLNAAPLRRALAAYAERRARDARRDARTQTVLRSRSGYNALLELTNLVDEIEMRDPELARRSDLEGLLDRHAALTVAHERALAAVQMSDRIQLERMRDEYRSVPDANPKRFELCERRLQCLDACEAQAERLADELAILADTIRLIAQHVACPDELLADDLIDRHLAELDENAAAHRQLATELHDPAAA